MFKITDFKIENLSKACITDNKRPRFSYSVSSDHNEAKIKFAEIKLNDWEKKIDDRQDIEYDGEQLKPFTEYKVTLSVCDETGEKDEKQLIFRTGRMGTPWSADFITDLSYKFTEKKTSPIPMTFKKKLEIKKPIKSAFIYSSAIGIYELFIDGARIGEDYFKPGFTSYKNFLQYQTYNVTDKLCGLCELTAVVAGGWAVGAFTYKRRNRIYAKRQALLLELHIDYEDGTKEVINSDSDFLVMLGGKFRAAEFYDGETFDSTFDMDKAIWKKAGVEKLKIHPEISAQYGLPVRAHEELTPVSSFKAKSGEIIYDFGQNFAGVIKAVIKGAKGQTVKFRHAEILSDGELFVKPLRSAKATAIFVCVSGSQEYSPLLTYMGFRYVGVSGIEESDLHLTALALYSDIETIGSFECSNEMLNKLQSNIVWSAKSNFIDIPTDCPQRDERMGWTGDISVFAPTAAYNFDMSRFLGKWLKDEKAEQKKSGGIPMTIPHVVVPMQMELMITMAVDFWGDSCILVPWAEYSARGDEQILKDMYPVMKRYLKAVKFWAGLGSIGKNRRIWRLLHHYGDWCAPNVNLMGWMGRGKWTATACWANSCAIVSKIAEILNFPSDQQYYKQLGEEVKRAYRDVFTDKKGKLKKEFQTAYVLPIYFDMLNGEEKAAAVANLSRLVRENDYHIATGFPGTPYILFALADNGFKEDAFKMLLNDTCPSWLYEIKAGGTTTWERWDALMEDGSCNLGNDGTNGMVSFNHYAIGAVGDFLYRRIAGIEAESCGYKKFRISPIIGGGITSAKGSLKTPYGIIVSDWKIADGEFEIEISVPVNSSCVLTLPSGKRHEMISGNYNFKEKYS